MTRTRKLTDALRMLWSDVNTVLEAAASLAEDTPIGGAVETILEYYNMADGICDFNIHNLLELATDTLR